MISKDQLHALAPKAKLEIINQFVEPLNETFEKFQINTPERQSYFLCHAIHESDRFRATEEYASGKAYDTRTDLGNTPEVDGDGEKYKGRGLFQITGTTNYHKCGQYFGQDFLNNPELLEGPLWASLSAGWYWDVFKNLNAEADKNEVNFKRNYKGKIYNKFEWITLRINGGQNGLKDRWEIYKIAKSIL